MEDVNEPRLRAENTGFGSTRLDQGIGRGESNPSGSTSFPTQADVVVARRQLDALREAQNALEEAVAGMIASAKLQQPTQALRREVSDAALAETGAGDRGRWERIVGHLESIRELLLEEDLAHLAGRSEFQAAFGVLGKALETAIDNAEPMTRQQNPNVQAVLGVVGIQTTAISGRVGWIAVECRNLSNRSIKTISDCLQAIFWRIEREGSSRQSNEYSSSASLDRLADSGTSRPVSPSVDRLSGSAPTGTMYRGEATDASR